MRELEKTCEQLRKTVNNETLKLNNLRTELDDNERESKLITERLKQLEHITQNITHLNSLNQQLECQYLRFTDDMPMTTHNNSLSSQILKDENNEHEQYKFVPLERKPEYTFIILITSQGQEVLKSIKFLLIDFI